MTLRLIAALIVVAVVGAVVPVLLVAGPKRVETVTVVNTVAVRFDGTRPSLERFLQSEYEPARIKNGPVSDQYECWQYGTYPAWMVIGCYLKGYAP